jgi:hypothetical protein
VPGYGCIMRRIKALGKGFRNHQGTCKMA